MTELDLLAAMRADVPLRAPSETARRALDAAIAAEVRGLGLPASCGIATAGRRTISWSGNRRHRKTVALALSLAAVAIAGAIVGVAEFARPRSADAAWSGRPLMAAQAVRTGSSGTARSAAELVDFARRAARNVPGMAPRPGAWVFVEIEEADSRAGHGAFLFGPPDQRGIAVEWIKADGSEFATLDTSHPLSAGLPTQTLVHGRLAFSPSGHWTLNGWRSVGYSYLESLPTSPGRLEAVILADDLPSKPWYSPSPTAAVFKAVATLLYGQCEGVVIPPKLAATLYGVLQRLPAVHFEAATDLAGRTGLGFSMDFDGWYEQELVVDPTTYAFMGEKTVALTDHKMVSTGGGTREVRSGQVLGWTALLDEAVVSRAGQLP